MAQNVYECLFIFDANRYARDPNGVSGAIPKMIEKLDGEILANRLWNEQRLAYQINGQRKGTYWLTYFKLDGEKVSAFNRQCQLNDNIMRNLTLKVDPRLVDALVAHAKGETPAEPETPADKAPEDKAPAEEKKSDKPAEVVAES